MRHTRRVRILAVSDLHYRLPHYDWLVRAADDVDVVAIVGDLADVVSPVPFTVQTVVLQKYLDLLAEKNPGRRLDMAGDFRTLAQNGFGAADHRLVVQRA